MTVQDISVLKALQLHEASGNTKKTQKNIRISPKPRMDTQGSVNLNFIKR